MALAPDCPLCRKEKVQAVRHVWYLQGLILAGRWGSVTWVGCHACTRRKVLESLALTSVVGWLSFPWGLGTPIVIVQNLVELFDFEPAARARRTFATGEASREAREHDVEGALAAEVLGVQPGCTQGFARAAYDAAMAREGLDDTMRERLAWALDVMTRAEEAPHAASSARRRARRAQAGAPVLIGAALWLAVSGAGIGALALLCAGFTFFASRSADVIVYNGFLRPIEVRADGVEHEVAPRWYTRVSLPARDVAVEAAFVGEEQPFEERVLELGGHGFDVTVYNVSGRAVLGVDKIWYGSEHEPEFQLLADPVTSRRTIDYVFVEPPQEIQINQKTAVRRAVRRLDDPRSPDVAIAWLSNREQAGAAGRLARAALQEGVRTRAVLPVLAQLTRDRGGDFNALCDELLAMRDDVDFHVFCQDAVPLVYDAERYRDELAAHPDSATQYFLLSRVVADHAESVVLLEQALALDPDHALAAAFLSRQHEVCTGDFESSLRLLEHALGVDPELEERLWEVVRLRRLLGRPAPTVAEFPSLKEGSLLTLADVLALDAERTWFAAVRARLEAETDEAGAELVAAHVGYAAAVVGDLDTLREMNRRGARMELLLALSDGATDADAPADLPVVEGRWAVLSWTLARRLGRDPTPHLDAIRASAPRVADLLESGRFDRRAVEDALVAVPPDLHGAVWFAAFRATGRRAFGEQAKRWAVPGELPFFEI